MISHRTRTIRAFTLIELMILCAIGSMLIALILSVVSSVRQTERRLVCTSNLRQIGVAIHAYAADNGGEIPTVYDPSGSGFHPTSWYSIGVWSTYKGIGGMLLLFGRPFGDAKHLYLDTPAIFRCPGDYVDFNMWGSDDNFSAVFLQGTRPAGMSYLYAYVPQGGGSDSFWDYFPHDKRSPGALKWTNGQFAGYERHNVNQRNAASTAIMIEGSAINALWLPHHPYECHGQGGNILYLDGHEVYGLIDVPNPLSMPMPQYIENDLSAADQLGTGQPAR